MRSNQVEKLASHAEPSQILKGAQESLLGNILSVLLLTQHPQCE